MPQYMCHKCNKSFNRKSSYDNHMYKRKSSCIKNEVEFNLNTSSKTSSNSSPKFWCSKCDHSYANKSNLNKHNAQFHCPTTDPIIDLKDVLTKLYLPMRL